MIKKIIYFSVIPAFIGILVSLSSCMTSKTAQSVILDDDVYYSNATANEMVVASQIVQEGRAYSDYVSDEELYGDTYRNYGYTDYAARINRFRPYHPSLSYYNSIYGFNYDPFFSPYYFPYSYYGSTGVNIGIGINNGFFSYNPWRFNGFNQGFNFWGPYSFYNPYNSIGFWGGNFNRGNFNRGFYSGIYSSPAFTSPNYRARPSRAEDNSPAGRIGMPGTVIRDNSGNIIQPRGRAERYGSEQGSGNSPSRPQPSTRPARVNQSPPARPSQPDRIYSAPRQDNGSGSRSSQPSNNNGGGSSSGPRPARGN